MSQGVTQSESIATPSETRPILSVVCVFNNRTVRQQCLDRSLRALEDRGQLIDYVPVDNTSGEFTTAGAALNDGARRARGQVITFAHQDVYVHSASRLQSAARLLVSGDWHLVGACGVSMNTPNIGKMRDRVVLDGVHTDLPLPVQTLDEVFVMALRDTVIEHPFSEDPTVAWHGYAVEYSLRLQSLGLRVGAMTLDITHNSLSTNMTGLDVAHRAIGRMFPSCTPIQTTCGEIHRWPVRRTLERLSRAKRPLHRWLKQSAQAWRIRRVVNGSQCVLSDIREDIDHLLALADGPIDVVNIDDDCVVDADLAAPLTLSRRDRVMTVRTETDLGRVLATIDPDQPTVVTNLQMRSLTGAAQGRDWSRLRPVLGFHYGQLWLLTGLGNPKIAALWAAERRTPAGMGRLGRRLRVLRSTPLDSMNEGSDRTAMDSRPRFR